MPDSSPQPNVELRGVYQIRHYATPTVALTQPSGVPAIMGRIPVNAAADHVGPDHDDYFDQFWFITPASLGTSAKTSSATYKICSIRTGTLLDVAPGTNAPGLGSPLVGTGTDYCCTAEAWTIEPKEEGKPEVKIKNFYTNELLSLNSDMTVTARGDITDERNDQRIFWVCERVSLTSEEITQKVEKLLPLKHSTYRNHQSDKIYIVIPDSKKIKADIWKISELNGVRWRAEIFDCDDFAFQYKAAVAKWAKNYFRADGFSVLCGLMFGSKDHGSHAFNWLLESHKPDSRVIWYDPLDQLTTYDHPWGYTGYFGLF